VHLPDLLSRSPSISQVAVKYASYLERQEKEVARMQSSQAAAIPPGAAAGLKGRPGHS
jgi:tRNA U34 5-carboxymethylaminomethyl modifying enzyme MnmG/GidA